MTNAYDFAAHLTRFCRALRGHGLLVGPSETADAVRALGAVDVMDPSRVYWTLRAALLSRRDDGPVFDALFERFWNFEPLPERPVPRGGSSPAGGARRLRPRPRSLAIMENDLRSKDTLIQVLRTGASAREWASGQELVALGEGESAELAAIAARMVRALASRPGRRRKRHRRKGTPDLRGAFRVNLATGGDLIRLPRMRRVPRVPRLLALLDVSGSMQRHTWLLLQLLFAVYQQTRRVETIVFSTRPTRVTRQMRAPSLREALRRMGEAVPHWSGGTRIGESLAQVNSDYEWLLDRFTTVMLLSDGWETGDPEGLARELRRMRRRVRRLVWLNPLLGTRDYEPLARGLRAAAPHVDDFAPAGDVASLKRLPALLRGRRSTS